MSATPVVEADVVRERVAEAVGSVPDPHLWLGLDKMGMIGDVSVDDAGSVTVGLTYPCIGCPAVELIESAVKRRVSEVSGVTTVRVRASWSKVWSKKDLDPQAAERLRDFGIQV